MRALRVVTCCLALVLASCSLFRAGKKDDDAQGASAAKVDPTRARYTLDVDAPRSLKQLLAQNLDLARFRDAPASEGLTSDELDRLVGMAPAQALGATGLVWARRAECRRRTRSSRTTFHRARVARR